jgi:hypothetical protein
MATISTVANASTTPIKTEIQPKMRCFTATPVSIWYSGWPARRGERRCRHFDGAPAGQP